MSEENPKTNENVEKSSLKRMEEYIIASYYGFQFPLLGIDSDKFILSIAKLRIDGFFEGYKSWFAPFSGMMATRIRYMGYFDCMDYSMQPMHVPVNMILEVLVAANFNIEKTFIDNYYSLKADDEYHEHRFTKHTKQYFLGYTEANKGFQKHLDYITNTWKNKLKKASDDEISHVFLNIVNTFEEYYWKISSLNEKLGHIMLILSTNDPENDIENYAERYRAINNPIYPEEFFHYGFEYSFSKRTWSHPNILFTPRIFVKTKKKIGTLTKPEILLRDIFLKTKVTVVRDEPIDHKITPNIRKVKDIYENFLKPQDEKDEILNQDWGELSEGFEHHVTMRGICREIKDSIIYKESEVDEAIAIHGRLKKKEEQKVKRWVEKLKNAKDGTN